MGNYQTAEREFRSLGLDTRTINILVGRNIHSLSELAELTEWDLSVMPGIGPKAFSQLKNYVQKNVPTSEIHSRSRAMSIVFNPACLTEIDAWGRENGIISRAAIVRHLVELGLKAKR
jgi:hypothetical protein